MLPRCRDRFGASRHVSVSSYAVGDVFTFSAEHNLHRAIAIAIVVRNQLCSVSVALFVVGVGECNICTGNGFRKRLHAMIDVLLVLLVITYQRERKSMHVLPDPQSVASYRDHDHTLQHPATVSLC